MYLQARDLAPGDEHGVGKLVCLHTRGWLPYSLRRRLATRETGSIEPLEEAGLAGVSVPQLGEASREGLGGSTPRGEVTEIDEQLDRQVVVLGPLRLDQRLHLTPQLLFPSAEGIQVRRARRCLLRLATRPLLRLARTLRAAPGRGALLYDRDSTLNQARSGHSGGGTRPRGAWEHLIQRRVAGTSSRRAGRRAAHHHVPTLPAGRATWTRSSPTLDGPLTLRTSQAPGPR